MTFSPEPRILVLMRHAQAAAQSEDGDHARGLTAVGRSHVATVGKQLARELPRVDLAMVSDARRAQDTYRLLRKAHPGLPAPTTSEELYHASPEAVMELLRGLDPQIRRVIVVAHEPAMSIVASYLAADLPGAGMSLAYGMATAEAAVLATTRSWQEIDRKSAQLHGVLRPS